jgi:predicted nucleotidyltransferase
MGNRTLTREEALDRLRRCKPDLERRFGVTRLGIFGSIAAGDDRGAGNVDVVVELREPDLFPLVHIRDTISETLRAPVDIVRFQESMNRYLKARILAEAVYV